VLAELTVRNLGVIDNLTVLLGPGMTALTGETGAGKTLVIEAIELLVGGRPDSVLVRAGAEEAWVEGRFVLGDGTETVLTRVVPATGRSRAYVDGRMAPVSALAETGAALVDLHGQHAHQSLLSPSVQRAALDQFGGLDLTELAAAEARVKELDQALLGLGGDARSRAREIDLLRFQVAELTDAGLSDPDEERGLADTEEILADATAHREAATTAYDVMQDEGGALDGLGQAVAALTGRAPYRELVERLKSAVAEITEAARDLRDTADGIADDPVRLAEVRARRQLLHDLRRKYGDTLADVLDFAAEAGRRLDELSSYDERAAALEEQRGRAVAAVAAAAARLGAARRSAAPRLASAIEGHLRKLALPRARFAVSVGEWDPGDDVVFGLGANPGEPVLPLTKVASGGELARTMLAARLVLSVGPPTLVFDEVDAGIGGEAAVAVGRALTALAPANASERQVVVVTHLPQVAAFADAQIGVAKAEQRGRTVVEARPLAGDARVVELSRMLSGRPDSDAARQHAAELLSAANHDKQATAPGKARSSRRATRRP
jgi:DNA repair protein RecN (Recombination protein N)